MTDTRRARRTTLADVAARAGVDRALVSRVVNADPTLRIREETRARIVAAVAELDYRASPTARSLRTSRSSTLGLVIPDFANPVWAAIVGAVERAADEAGLTLLTASADSTPGRIRRFLDLLDAHSLDAVLVAAPLADANPSVDLAGRRVLLLNQQVAGGRSVVFDDAGAVELAVTHLVELGHHRIAHLAGPPRLDAPVRRAAAFQAAMEARGLDPSAVLAGEMSTNDGAARTASLLDRPNPPTALVVANVASAAGALRAARAAGSSVPDDLSVVCIHDLPVCEELTPALTAVRLPLAELGARAVQEILQPGETESVVVGGPTSVIVRDSTSPAARR